MYVMISNAFCSFILARITYFSPLKTYVPISNNYNNFECHQLWLSHRDMLVTVLKPQILKSHIAMFKYCLYFRPVHSLFLSFRTRMVLFFSYSCKRFLVPVCNSLLASNLLYTKWHQSFLVLHFKSNGINSKGLV